MLGTVKKYIKKNSNVSFESKFIDYMIGVQNTSILLEMQYLIKYNKLDVLKLDKLIDASFKEAIEHDKF